MARILLIDDDELVIQSVEKLLLSRGYEVISVRSGQEAVEQIKQADFDLIITDIRMPDLNGLDTLSKIRQILKEKERSRIPEICITGDIEDKQLKRVEQLGVAGSFFKPFDMNDFLGRIESVLKAHQMQYFSYSEKTFVYKYVVMLTDTDQFQHMSFANYLKLMFLAADALLVPCLNHNFLAKTRLKLTASSMQFKRQTAPGDTVLVKVNASEISNSSFSLLFTFLVKGSGELVGLGRQAYELVSVATNTQEPIPNQIKNVLVSIKVGEGDIVTGIEMKNLEESAHKTFVYDKIDVFFKHTDYHGFVHPYNYLEWTSYVREAFFSEICDEFREIIASPVKMMTARIGASFKSNSSFGDHIEARFCTSKIKKVSFDVNIVFVNKETQEELCATKHTLVFVDSRTNEFTHIPAPLKKVVSEYEVVTVK